MRGRGGTPALLLGDAVVPSALLLGLLLEEAVVASSIPLVVEVQAHDGPGVPFTWPVDSMLLLLPPLQKSLLARILTVGQTGEQGPRQILDTLSF